MTRRKRNDSMAIDNRTTADILLDALTYGKTEVVVSDVNSDSNAAHNMIVRLKSHKVTTAGWRYYQRSTPERKTVVIVMSPRCQDPAPPTHVNAKKKAQPKPKPEPQKKSLLAEWVLTNLCSSRMLHISVVPYQDIKTLKGVSNYEAYMTDKVSKALKRADVRVMVREVHYPNLLVPKAYNATLVFL